MKAAQEFAAERQRLRNADYDAVTQHLANEREAFNQRMGALRDGNTQLKEEVATLGLSKQALVAHEAALLEDAAAEMEVEAARLEAIDSTNERARQLRTEIALLRERRDLVLQKGHGEIAIEEADKARDAWQKTVDDINDSLTDALLRGFEDGKGFAENFRDTLVNMFKTLVLKPIIQATLSPISNGIASMLGAPAGAGGSVLGSVSNAASIYNAGSSAWTVGSQWLGGSMSTANAAGTIYANATKTGIDGLLATNGAYGTAGAGFGTMAAGAGAMAVIAMVAVEALQSLKGERRGGGTWGVDSSGGVKFLEGPDGERAEGSDAIVEQLLSSTVTGLNDTFRAIGSGLTVTAFKGAYETSQNGRGGVFAGGRLSNGVAFGERGTGTNYNFQGDPNLSKYELWGATATDYLTGVDLNGDPAKLATDVQQAFVAALQASVGIVPRLVKETFKFESSVGQTDATAGATFEKEGYRWLRVFDDEMKQRARDLGLMPKKILDLIVDVDPEALSAEATTALTTKIGAMVANVNAFRSIVEGMPVEALKNASFDVAEGLVAMAGGAEAFATNLASYVDNFYTPAEKQAQAIRNIAGVLQGVGYQIADGLVISEADIAAAVNAGDDARSIFRGWVDSIDTSSEAGQRAYTALMQVAGAFAQLTPAAAAVGEVVSDVVDEVTGGVEEVGRTLDDFLGDVSKAFGALQTAVDNERKAIAASYEGAIDRVNARIEALNGSVGKLSDLSDLLGSTLSSFNSDERLGMGRAAASAQIATALAIARAGGVLPDSDSLREALNIISEPSEDLYSSFVEYATAFDQQVGTISELNAIAGDQLDAEQQALRAEQDQLELLRRAYDDEMQRLDDLLSEARRQVDAVNGVEVGVLSVERALESLSTAIAAAVANGAPVPPPAGGSAGGSSGAGSSGAGTAAGGSDLDILFGHYLGRDPSASDYSFYAGWTPTQIATGILNSPEYAAIRGYASGGLPAGLALVGEQGPELIDFTTPGRVYNAAQTRGMFAGDGGSRRDDERQLLRQILSEMENGNFAIAAAAIRIAKVVERWDADGIPEEREVHA